MLIRALTFLDKTGEILHTSASELNKKLNTTDKTSNYLQKGLNKSFKIETSLRDFYMENGNA